MRWRPYLIGTASVLLLPGTAEVGMGASAEIRGRSFVVLAEVTIDTTGAEGVLFKQGGGHGGHVLFIQDGRLHYVYNFMGEEEQVVSSPGAVPLGTHIFGVAFTRTGTVENSHTPLGDVTLYIDDVAVASRSDVKIHPGTFGLAGATISVGRNTGSAVSSTYKAPFAFTGGTIAQVNVDVSGTPYATWKKNSHSLSRRTDEWSGEGRCDWDRRRPDESGGMGGVRTVVPADGVASPSEGVPVAAHGATTESAAPSTRAIPTPEPTCRTGHRADPAHTGPGGHRHLFGNPPPPSV